MTNLNTALAYAQKGFHIFPCNTSKAPIPKKGFKAATTNTKTITDWWTKHPDAYIGVDNSDVLVIDFDLKSSVAARSSMSILTVDLDIDSPLKSTTKSGGIHHFFAPFKGITRKLKVLPGLDICGEGGYSILPDGITYKPKGMSLEKFIEGMGDLPTINEEFDEMVDWGFGSFVPDSILDSLRALGEDERSKAPPKSRKSKKPAIEEDTLSPEHEKQIEERKKAQDELNANMYARSTSQYENFISYDPFDGNKKIRIEHGSLTSERFNNIFYNPHTQQKLRKLHGIPSKLNSQGRSKKFRSLLETHVDKRPSMGLRLSETGNQDILRDFSNHFDDHHNNIDYSYTALFIANKTRSAVGRVSAPYFCTTTMLMLDENGLLDYDLVELPFSQQFLDLKFTKKEQQVVRLFQRLVSYKKFYDGGDGTTTLTRRFASAYGEVSINTAKNALRKMRRHGIMERVDTFGEGYYETGIYKMGEKPEPREMVPPTEEAQTEEHTHSTRTMSIIEKLRGNAMTTKNTEIKEGLQTRVKKVFEDYKQEKTMATDDQNEVTKEVPLATVFGMELDNRSKQTVKNFAVDYGFGDTVPEDKYLSAILAISESIAPIDQDFFGGNLIMNEFYITAEEIEGNTHLMVNFASVEGEKILDKIIRAYPDAEIEREEEFDFVLSYDYGGDTSEEWIDHLTIKFNEYAGGFLVASKDITGHYDEVTLNGFLIGKDDEK